MCNVDLFKKFNDTYGHKTGDECLIQVADARHGQSRNSDSRPPGLKSQTACVNTILYCRKWKETVAFYKTGLQLPVTEALDWFVEFRLTPTACLSIADASRTTRNSSRGEGHLITFQVHDIEETRSWICRAGLNPTPVKNHPWGAKVMYLSDPEGNQLEFWC